MTAVTLTTSTPTYVWAEIEAISDQIRRELSCPVCLMLASDMKCLCTNGHAVCHACVIKLRIKHSSHYCPLCRSPLDLNVSSATTVKLAEIVATVRLACTYRQYGCNELYLVRDVPDHELVCVHKPIVCCLESTCQWTGNYDQLHEHVSRMYVGVYVETTKNSLSVDDIKLIALNRRLTYLVRSPVGMFWVVLTRTARSLIRTGVFMVENWKSETSSGLAADATPKFGYCVKWFDEKGRSRNRCVVKCVGLSASLREDICTGNRGTADSYTLIKSRLGRMVFNWFHYPTTTG